MAYLHIKEASLRPPTGRHLPSARRRKKSTRAKTDLPERLRSWRKRKKLTQSAAAIELRMPLRTFQEWEQGRAEPRGLAFSAIAKAIR